MHSHYFWTGRWLTDVESDAVLTAQERPSGTYSKPLFVYGPRG